MSFSRRKRPPPTRSPALNANSVDILWLVAKEALVRSNSWVRDIPPPRERFHRNKGDSRLIPNGSLEVLKLDLSTQKIQAKTLGTLERSRSFWRALSEASRSVIIPGKVTSS